MLYFIQNTDERCKNNYVHVRCNSLFYRKKSQFFHVRCNIMMLPKNVSIFTRPVRHDDVAEKFISQKVYRQTIILAKFVSIFKVKSVPQTGCRQRTHYFSQICYCFQRKFCSTNGLPATHYFGQIYYCFQSKLYSTSGMPATNYFGQICYCFHSKFCSTNGLPATHCFGQICHCFQSKFYSRNQYLFDRKSLGNQ